MKDIIAIIGRAGSGKDYAGDYLSKKLSIPSFPISEALRITATKRGIEPSRENLITIGKEFSQSHGDEYLAKIIVENTRDKKIIITGMRQIGQVEYCKNLHNTTFVGIESDTRLRYRRLIKNKKFSGDYESFLNIEKLDEGSIQNVGKCLEYCDIMIENNGSPEEFERSLSVLTK